MVPQPWQPGGAPSLGTGSQPITETISSGGYHNCTIRSDRSVVCWGNNTYDQATPPAGLKLVQISSGEDDNCGVKTDGTVACWGASPFISTTTHTLITATTYSQVATGAYHACGVKTDGTVACWGENVHGEAPPVTTTTYSQVAVGDYFSCGIKKADGTLACWGQDWQGQIEPPSGGAFAQLSADANHTCAVRSDGTGACWGYSEYGEGAAPSGSYLDMAAGQSHTCSLQTNHTLLCWGYDNDAQDNAPFGPFVQVSAGGFHSCALRSDGTIACWGDNADGESPTISPGPVSLPAGSVGSPYTQTLSASGGTAPYAFSVATGSPPAGLSLAGGGSLSGTPTAAGSSTFVVEAADQVGLSGQITYTLQINRAASYTSLAGPATNPSDYGQPLTFTATVTSTVGNPTGVVTFTVRRRGADRTNAVKRAGDAEADRSERGQPPRCCRVWQRRQLRAKRFCGRSTGGQGGDDGAQPGLLRHPVRCLWRRDELYGHGHFGERHAHGVRDFHRRQRDARRPHPGRRPGILLTVRRWEAARIRSRRSTEATAISPPACRRPMPRSSRGPARIPA